MINIAISNIEDFNYWFSVVTTIVVYILPILLILALIANLDLSSRLGRK